MKKFLLALLVLPLMASLTACHDDGDDLPAVDIDVTYTNGTVVNGQVYVVQGQEFGVASIVTTATRDGKNATNGAVSYWINNIPIGTTDVEPFGFTLSQEWTAQPGYFYIEFMMPVYEEGCSLATAYARVKVNVVASAEDIPSADTPSVSQRLDYSFKDN